MVMASTPGGGKWTKYRRASPPRNKVIPVRRVLGADGVTFESPARPAKESYYQRLNQPLRSTKNAVRHNAAATENGLRTGTPLDASTSRILPLGTGDNSNASQNDASQQKSTPVHKRLAQGIVHRMNVTHSPNADPIKRAPLESPRNAIPTAYPKPLNPRAVLQSPKPPLLECRDGNAVDNDAQSNLVDVDLLSLTCTEDASQATYDVPSGENNKNIGFDSSISGAVRTALEQVHLTNPRLTPENIASFLRQASGQSLGVDAPSSNASQPSSLLSGIKALSQSSTMTSGSTRSDKDKGNHGNKLLHLRHEANTQVSSQAKSSIPARRDTHVKPSARLIPRRTGKRIKRISAEVKTATDGLTGLPSATRSARPSNRSAENIVPDTRSDEQYVSSADNSSIGTSHSERHSSRSEVNPRRPGKERAGVATGSSRDGNQNVVGRQRVGDDAPSASVAARSQSLHADTGALFARDAVPQTRRPHPREHARAALDIDVFPHGTPKVQTTPKTTGNGISSAANTRPDFAPDGLKAPQGGVIETDGGAMKMGGGDMKTAGALGHARSSTASAARHPTGKRAQFTAAEEMVVELLQHRTAPETGRSSNGNVIKHGNRRGAATANAPDGLASANTRGIHTHVHTRAPSRGSLNNALHAATIDSHTHTHKRIGKTPSGSAAVGAAVGKTTIGSTGVAPSSTVVPPNAVAVPVEAAGARGMRAGPGSGTTEKTGSGPWHHDMDVLQSQVLQWLYLVSRAEAAYEEQQCTAHDVLHRTFEHTCALKTTLAEEQMELARLKTAHKTAITLDALEGGIKLLHSAVSSARPHYIRLCEAVRQTTQVLPTTGFSSESIEPLLQALQACDEQLMRVMQASRQSLPDMSSIARDLVELRNVVAEEIHTVEACIDKVATLTTGHDSTPT